MCACDAEIGHRFLSHQLSRGVELETQKRVPVTLGFQARICNECRGLPLVSAPASSIPGRTSKIKRYYWRDLAFGQMKRFAEWEQAHPHSSQDEINAAREHIEKEVLDSIKALHNSTPKYDTREPSQAEVLERYGVQVDAFHPEYSHAPERGALIILQGKTISPEAYATYRYQEQGWSVMPLESAPIHALFGVMMWLLVEDPLDSEGQFVGFGSRTEFSSGGQGQIIRMHLPQDFGTRGYGVRRGEAIARHFDSLIPDGAPCRDTLLYLFDYWRDHSEQLRQYLWAHRDNDVDRARRLIEILPADTIVSILRYLVADYWGRYIGWPDLLLFTDKEFVFVEVKSSSDKLSAEQMEWIANNHDILKLPFRVAKLHRPARQQTTRPTPPLPSPRNT